MTYFYYSQGASNGHAVYYKYNYLDSMAEENGHIYAVLNNSGQGRILIREEGNKIYIRPLMSYFNGFIVTDPGEFLYFNYDLQDGDTFQMPLIDQTSSETVSVHQVLSIDSMMINNVWHKVFHVNVVSGFGGTYSFTEGLGTLQGPIVVKYGPAYSATLICFQNNGMSPVPNFSNCSELTSMEETDITAGFFEIMPNPATGKAFINYTGPTKSNFELDLIDVTGRNIMHAAFVKNIQIDLSRFSPGLFFLHIMNEKGSKITKKLIVRH